MKRVPAGQRPSAPAGGGTPQTPRVAASVPRQRLDVALVARGLVESREKAVRLVMAGTVRVDGQPAAKPSVVVTPSARIEVIKGPAFVSRGGDKLTAALDAFRVVPDKRICIDVGASTGGFTHCLLERGAARVYAVDVGRGQLDARLRADGRVVVMERINARALNPDAFPERPDLATVDVSFISLEKVMSAVFAVLTARGEAVVLVKPQFEAGRQAVGKGGVVRDPADHRVVLERLARFAVLHGWHVQGVEASTLRGPKGNREFFLHVTKTGRTVPELSTAIARVVASA
jgi:23S rRNA (cytidine1920-2'-O)/16S rRNA (cytidine1409-2'-O)-methyltransferase